MNAALETSVDSRNPWLGLASFSEETRNFFFGREEEVAELARRVQRKLLTVLFGQSGLGKTSILRAGLVPRLRVQGYCPVYVRIDYAADAPEPSEQIKRAIAQTAKGSGEWTQVGVAAAGESLWEFLHHRDDVLKDETGLTLIPLLIFDQFEEIFTLAQNDDAGRARAARFIQDLADLVENRPPRELEARLDTDDAAAERFDFSRSDYRVLIALREDYLAPLESLKRAMPSISQNRLRLAPMTGQQALAAVMKPGKGLVNEEVAAAIVRFVAGGAELQNAEVEPALLSLVCRELNDARIAVGRSEISPDLLEGSQDTILSNFYERSLADQPAAVRRIVEDQLLTASGFRENIAEERLVAAFKAAGIDPGTLATLVNRRLLRVEERLDLRRVELTHDVLCGVVKASRDLRQEREAREASDRLLQEQRDKEAAARRALTHARRVAAVCAVLALFAVVAAALAALSLQRARRAEAATQQARIQAEALLGYLSDDFATELETYGQLPTISEMARREIAYFRGLPQSLKSGDSTRNGALALIEYSQAERNQGHAKTAHDAADEAVALLESVRARGDASAATAVALARAYEALGHVLNQEADPRNLEISKRAVALIAPIASAADASEASRKAYVGILTQVGYAQTSIQSEFKDGVANLQHARDVAAALGGRELRTPEVAALYVNAGVWKAELLQRLGQEDEARDIDTEVDRIARKILETRPYYGLALHALQVGDGDLGTAAAYRMDPAEAVHYGKLDLEVSEQMLRRDPTGTTAINNTTVAMLMLGDAAWTVGNPQESFDYYRRALQLYKRVEQGGQWFVLNSLVPAGTFGQRLAETGDEAAARAMESEVARTVVTVKKAEPAGSRVPMFVDCALQMTNASVALGLGDFKAARDKGASARQAVRGIEPNAPFEGFLKYVCEFYAPALEGEALLWSGDFGAAERTLKAAVAVRDKYPPGSTDEVRGLTVVKILEALAIARQGHLSEAAALIEPQVAYERGLAARNHGDVTQYMELAESLYVQSLTDKPRQAALRREALALIDKSPEAFRKLRTTLRWRQMIQSGA